MEYRKDIDGLRAIAVVSVVLFHFGNLIPGGFVGVDIFFVISGYLITQKLTRQIERDGRLSIADFYAGRVRRILPALLAMLVVTAAVGWFFLLPGDYANFGESAAYAAVGAGNIYFHGHTGYFDAAANLQPLLHTWSLGVEEQFYLAWPLLLAALTRLAPKRRLVAVTGVTLVTILSFRYSLHLITTAPKSAFFWPHPRAWELALGAALSFAPKITSRPKSELIKFGGLSLICFSFLTLRSDDAFPGWGAVAPVIGAALIIWPGPNGWIARGLSVWPMRFIGTISYSLYLWHWPILVFFRHFNNDQAPDALSLGLLAILSFCISVISWRFIETPPRKTYLTDKALFLRGTIAVFATVAIGAGISAWSGFPFRIPSDIQAMQSFDTMWDWDCPQKREIPPIGRKIEFCILGDDWETAKTKGFLWGDSQSRQLAPYIDVLARDHHAAFVLFDAGPPIIDGVHVTRKYPNVPNYAEVTSAARAEAIKFLRDNKEITNVIATSLWVAMYPHLYGNKSPQPSEENGLNLLRLGLREFANQIANENRSVTVIASMPIWPQNPVFCRIQQRTSLVRRSCEPDMRALSTAAFRRSQSSENDAIRPIADASKGIRTLFPGDFLCRDENCIDTIDGDFLYINQTHLRRNLSKKTMRDYAKASGLDTVFQPRR